MLHEEKRLHLSASIQPEVKVLFGLLKSGRDAAVTVDCQY